eukprot:scaffold96328_cov66-Phaeocystis_antarctica.AAC.3
MHHPLATEYASLYYPLGGRRDGHAAGGTRAGMPGLASEMLRVPCRGCVHAMDRSVTGEARAPLMPDAPRPRGRSVRGQQL